MKYQSPQESINCSSLLSLSNPPQINFKIRNPVLQSHKSTFSQSKGQSQAKDLEEKVIEIEDITKSIGFTAEVFNSYQEIFSQIISTSGKNKKILVKIKNAYETWIKILTSMRKKYEDAKNQMEIINMKIQNEFIETQTLLNYIQRLGKNQDFNDKQEINEIFEHFGLNHREIFDTLNDEVKEKIVVGFKRFVDQTFSKIKEEIWVSHDLEKTIYKVFNCFVRKGLQVEKVLMRIDRSDLIGRWKYFNENLDLKPYGNMTQFILSQGCGTVELFTFRKINRIPSQEMLTSNLLVA